MADIRELEDITFVDGVTILGEAQLTPMLLKINELVRKVNGLTPTESAIDLEMNFDVKTRALLGSNKDTSSTRYGYSTEINLSEYKGKTLRFSRIARVKEPANPDTAVVSAIFYSSAATGKKVKLVVYPQYNVLEDGWVSYDVDLPNYTDEEHKADNLIFVRFNWYSPLATLPSEAAMSDAFFAQIVTR